MPEVTYASIEALITAEEQSGRSLRFAFTCPASGKVVEASAAVARDNSATNQVADRAKRSVLNQVRWSIARSIRQAFGYSSAVGRVVGDVVGSVVDGAARAATDPNRVSSAQREQAAVAAFVSVQRMWVWDAANGRWMSSQAAQESMSAFEQQLNAAPVTEAYDRSICSRMLVEVSGADGRISRDEEAFLLEFLDPSVAGPQALASQPRLTPAELSQTSSGPARQTMLMLAWALALSDEELAQPERERLAVYAQGLGLQGQGERQATEAAQRFILDQVLDRVVQFGGGFTERTRAQIGEAAQRLGMSAEQAQVAEARYRKRKGLF